MIIPIFFAYIFPSLLKLNLAHHKRRVLCLIREDYICLLANSVSIICLPWISGFFYDHDRKSQFYWRSLLFRNHGGWKVVDDILEVLKEKKLSTKNSILAKLPFSNEGEIKKFWDKYKLKDFITSGSVLQDC